MNKTGRGRAASSCKGILTGTLDERVCDIRTMCGKECGGIECWVVQVRRRRASLEQVGGDRHEAGAGERVGKTEAIRYTYWGAVSIMNGAAGSWPAHSLFSVRLIPNTSVRYSTAAPFVSGASAPGLVM